ncbi:uncharacterized protein LOC109854563 isoform X2 [Pseudomyrmex gracilis]|uniref:uncharacterized protein LOC109854563 isoform X2 n=1 Tax=Pseudomyrmex gracilis TaxID=219809 RepID=UPI000994B01F|nr:uncharacterized protein LOC109854563 isoform X2 [Pseudomyrmex gracilis]
MDSSKFSVLTFLSSMFCMYLSNDYKNSTDNCDVDVSSLLINENQKLDEESIRQELEKSDRIHHRLMTPRRSVLPTKRWPTILTFEEHETAERYQRQPAARKITDLLPEEKKSKVRSFSLNSPSRSHTCWENCIAESTITTSNFDVDLPTVSDSDKFSLHEIDYDNYDQTLQSSAMLQDNSEDRTSWRRNLSRAIFGWLITLCIWLKKKLSHWLKISYAKLKKMIFLTQTSQIKKLDRLVKTMHSENEKILCEVSEKVTRLSAEFVQMRMCTETTLNDLTAQIKVINETSKKMIENDMALTQELKQLRKTLEEDRLKYTRPPTPFSLCPLSSSSPPRLTLPPTPSLPSLNLESTLLPPPPPPFPSAALQTALPRTQPTTPNSSKKNKSKTPTRKCSTPLFNRPSITVDDLLKVTLKKAPSTVFSQSHFLYIFICNNTNITFQDNRRSIVSNSKGPVVSLEMLRNVKLRSAKRRSNDPTGKSPRSGRVIKTRTASPISLSPILTSSEGNLERILRQVDLNKPRRLLSASSSFRDFGKEKQEKFAHSQSHSVID